MFPAKLYSFQSLISFASSKLESAYRGFFQNAQQKNAEEIMTRLAPFVDPDLSYYVQVHDFEWFSTATANLKGNQCRVTIYKGLWNSDGAGLNKNDKDELAAVIGHEMAHCAMDFQFSPQADREPRDSAEILLANKISAIKESIHILFANYASKGLQPEKDSAEDIQFDQLIGSHQFSIHQLEELRADYLGMIYMSQAGYNPEAAVRVWARISEQEGSEPDSTHPSNGKRAKFLQEHLSEAKKQAPEKLKQ